MSRIHEDMTVYQILNAYPFLLDIFKQHGMGKFEDPEVLEKLGPFLKLKTALGTLSLHKDLFIELLNTALREQESSADFTLADSPDRQRELTVLALLPCGMKMPFNRTFDQFVQDYNEKHLKKLRYLVEGNVNHELSYYAYIDSVTDTDELPDVIISSDINSFYHEPFKEKFLKKDLFEDTAAYPMHKDFSAVDYSDPNGQFTMFSANLLVLVSLNEQMKGRPTPSSWEDILDERFANSVVMRGQKEFFCNGVLLPFYRLFGMEGIKKMGRSIVTGVHPSQMVKMIDTAGKDVPPLYIMPYFFAMKIKRRDRVTVHVPKEGAIVSPVQMLVKKSSREEVREITDYLCGREFGQVCADAYFPSVDARVKNVTSDITPLFWPGWNFLSGTDVGKLKEDIKEVFMKEFYGTGGSV